MKAIGYIRYNECTTQERIDAWKTSIEKYIRENGHENCGIFTDVSSGCNTNPAELSRILSQAGDDSFNIIVINGVAHLTRNQAYLMNILKMLGEKNIKVFDLSTGQDLTAATDSFSRIIDISNAMQNAEANGGAVCEYCGQRMLIADGCTCSTIIYKGKSYKRIPFGEGSFPAEDDRCHDCGTMVGFYHHSGCDNEECPICGEQLLGCDCDIEFATEE